MSHLKSRPVLKQWQHLSNDMRPKVRYWLPAAAVDDEDLIEDLRQIQERGFGGVEVCSRTILPQILRSEEGWGKPHWEHVIKLIGETAAKLGMTMDITNGPAWPISMPGITSADDDAAACELTYSELWLPDNGQFEGELPERNTVRGEGTPKLVATMVYLTAPKDQKELICDSYMDVTDQITYSVQKLPDDLLNSPYESFRKTRPQYKHTFRIALNLPQAPADQHYVLLAFYEQPTGDKVNAGQFYVIDHLGMEGANACKAYWKTQMEAHDGLRGVESIFCDSLEYQSCFEWGHNFAQEFERRRGYSLLPFLPVISYEKTLINSYSCPGFTLDKKEVGCMVNHDYMETLTDCFIHNHLIPLEEMAESYGKTVRYQVAYNKPFEIERSALYVAIPENEALGRAAIDSQKAMASAAHLGRKQRYSFECAAEYGNAYGQDYEDLMWWVNRSIMAGMNAQVLHGAAYSGAYHGILSENGHVPYSQWPGFEPFRKCVSNYWNRTPDISHARGVLDTITRLNTIARKRAKVDLAIYRQKYINTGNGSENYEWNDGGILLSKGYSYEYVSSSLLDLEVCKVDNKILDREGVAYQALIVPEQQALSVHFIEQVEAFLNAGLPIIWVGKKPYCAMYYSEFNSEGKCAKWHHKLEELWKDQRISHAEDKKDVPMLLERMKILPRIQLRSDDGEQPGKIITAVRKDGGRLYYMLYRYNSVENNGVHDPETFGSTGIYVHNTSKPSYKRPGAPSKAICSFVIRDEETDLSCSSLQLCNQWTGETQEIDCHHLSGSIEGTVEIEEDELIILMVDSENRVSAVCSKNNTGMKIERLAVNFEKLQLFSFDPASPADKTFFRSGFAVEPMEYNLSGDKLLPWPEMDKSLEFFAGKGVYTGTFFVPENLENIIHCTLYFENVCDTFLVDINGKATLYPDQQKKQVDITELIRPGGNTIKVEVVSNLYNKVVGPVRKQPDLIFRVVLPYHEKKYGIYGKFGIQIVCE